MTARPEERGAKAHKAMSQNQTVDQPAIPELYYHTGICLLTAGVLHSYPLYCDGQGRPLRGESSEALRCPMTGAAIIYGRRKRVDVCLSALRVLLLLRLLGREFVLLFIALLPRRFCALTERLCLSSSPQAFREKLDQKLGSRLGLSGAQVCCREMLFSLAVSAPISDNLSICVFTFIK